jgi:hypothetical protein
VLPGQLDEAGADRTAGPEGAEVLVVVGVAQLGHGRHSWSNSSLSVAQPAWTDGGGVVHEPV